MSYYNYTSINLDLYYYQQLQEIICVLTKYLRRHNTLWKYVYYNVSVGEVDTSYATLLQTSDQKRVAIHILKYYNQIHTHVSYGQIYKYTQSLIDLACSDFLALWVEDSLCDHLPVSILMSLTEIERVTACRCLEHMRSIYKKYPNMREFPYQSLLLEAHLVNTSKISKFNYEIIRKAIHPKCKNFHVNILLSSIVHISHNSRHSPIVPIMLNPTNISKFFDGIDVQFMLALTDCNSCSNIVETDESDIIILSYGPVSYIPQSISDKLPTQSISDRLPTQSISDRLSTQSISDRLSTQSISDRLPTQSISDRLPTQSISDRLPTLPTQENMTDELYQSQLDVTLSLEAKDRLSKSDLMEGNVEIELDDFTDECMDECMDECTDEFELTTQEFKQYNPFDFSLHCLLEKVMT